MKANRHERKPREKKNRHQTTCYKICERNFFGLKRNETRGNLGTSGTKRNRNGEYLGDCVTYFSLLKLFHICMTQMKTEYCAILWYSQRVRIMHMTAVTVERKRIWMV